MSVAVVHDRNAGKLTLYLMQSIMQSSNMHWTPQQAARHIYTAPLAHSGEVEMILRLRIVLGGWGIMRKVASTQESSLKTGVRSLP